MTWTPTCAWCRAETWDCRHSITGQVACAGCIDNAERDGFGHVCASCGAFAALEDNIEFGTVDAPHDACPDCYAALAQPEHREGAAPRKAAKETRDPAGEPGHGDAPESRAATVGGTPSDVLFGGADDAQEDGFNA